jgi:DNA-binding transcriptional ArsR family regulator
MVKHEHISLDAIFAALSHSTRRETLDMLGRGARSVSHLAAPHDMSLAGFMKHLHALEAAGLIACAKAGRTVTCELAPRPLRRASEWVSSRERLWSGRLDALGRHLYQLEETTSVLKRRR